MRLCKVLTAPRSNSGSQSAGILEQTTQIGAWLTNSIFLALNEDKP
jgi:hypothetical protein